MKSRDRSYLPPATTLRRGYKQKTRSNDWMSHRKPLIFTQESFSSPFKMFYNSVGRFPPIPRRLRHASHVAISDLFIPPETHHRFFGCIQFFPALAIDSFYRFAELKMFMSVFIRRVYSPSSMGLKTRSTVIPTADNDIKVQISGCN